jgi:hypothetical protein
MKLSIWQQFSSNHSGTFELVGYFSTPEDAMAAYTKLMPFLKELAEFVDTYEGYDIFKTDYARHMKYSPPEEKFYQANEIDPRVSAVEWMWTISDELDVGITQFDNLIIMQSVSDLANDGIPFDQLLEKWGANVMLGSEGGNGGKLCVMIRCVAKDEEQAETLWVELSNYYPDTPPPWASYFGGKEQESINWLKRWMESELKFLTLEATDIPENIKRDGRVIHIEDICFEFGWTRGFTALIAWLRSQDCVVEYQFKRVWGNTSS